METKQTYDIRVHAETQYLDDQSDPAKNHYIFAYTITIENHGKLAAQLISRHWIITDAEGYQQEVHGTGVVGEQPYLQPGEGFQYTSGTVLKTPVGAMQGSYQMRAEDGAVFDAMIEPFGLSSGSLH